jgi:hypothetical protein
VSFGAQSTGVLLDFGVIGGPKMASDAD